ncbi:UNKNOWN [Stylonychia lemnae]|uniref:Uncharacterized protein n=1 Tax=Stylonychia lemnae TaxID=5949 RepID=A0A078BBC1_STYLE|nr:UNKNOWN [Stylonychia lemnae]|eukprot:CDW91689.1 UNKNOWN [Stylonychia lemnae]
MNLNQDQLHHVMEKLVISLSDHIDKTTKLFQDKSEHQIESNLEIKDLKTKLRDVIMRQEGFMERLNILNEMAQNTRKSTQSLTTFNQQHILDFKNVQEQVQIIFEQLSAQKQCVTLMDSKLTSFEKLADIQMNGGISKMTDALEQINSLYLSKEYFMDRWRQYERFKEATEVKLEQMANLNPKQIETQFREINARLIPLEEQMRTKIDCDLFDDEIDKIKTLMVNNQHAHSGYVKVEQVAEKSVRQKDLMAIKEKAQKIDDCLIACINFEKKLQQYAGFAQKMEEIESTFDECLKIKDLEDLEIKVEHHRLSLVKIDSYIEKSKVKLKEQSATLSESKSMVSKDYITNLNQLDSHDSWLRRIKEQIDELKMSQHLMNKTKEKPSFGINLEDNQSIEEKLAELIDDVEKTKESLKVKSHYLSQSVDAINIQLKKKLDKVVFEQFKDTEFFSSIKDTLIPQLKKTFPEKTKTVQSIDKIEKVVQTITKQVEALTQNTKNSREEEDVMLSKKNYQCLSCDKNLINIQSSPAEYYTWSKLPLKEPGDRIARLGKGFSKILGNYKIEKQIIPTINIAETVVHQESIENEADQDDVFQTDYQLKKLMSPLSKVKSAYKSHRDMKVPGSGMLLQLPAASNMLDELGQLSQMSYTARGGSRQHKSGGVNGYQSSRNEGNMIAPTLAKTSIRLKQITKIQQQMHQHSENDQRIRKVESSLRAISVEGNNNNH